MGLRPPHRFSAYGTTDLPVVPAYGLGPGHPTPGRPFTSASPHRCNKRYRNIDLFAIAYAFRPRLRSRLTLSGLTFLRNPWVFGGRVSRPSYRYSFRHHLFPTLHSWSPTGFTALAMLPYHSSLAGRVRGFGGTLSPGNYRRGITRLVSYYALFK